MNIGDIVRIRAYGLVLGEPASFHMDYYCGSIGTGIFQPDELASAFNDAVVDALVEVMSHEGSVVGIEVKSLNVPSEYVDYVYAVPRLGDEIVDSMPSPISFTLAKARPFPPLRNGYIHTWAVPKSFIDGNVPTPSALGLLNTLCFQLEGALIDASGFGFSPIVQTTMLPILPAGWWAVTDVRYTRIGHIDGRQP